MTAQPHLSFDQHGDLVESGDAFEITNALTYDNGDKWAGKIKSHGDPEVVHVDDLAPLIDRFCDEWEAERPTGIANTFGASERTFDGPIAWLSRESGVGVRQLSRYRNRHVPYVGLAHADAILQAMGTGYRLDDDVPVHKNPRWSMERWQEYMSERGCV